MLLSDLQYDLPLELIAQQPAAPRDAARLLVLERLTGTITQRCFRDIGAYLAPGDCLVLNDTRVIPARFFYRRASGGRVEGLFLHADGAAWRVMLKHARRLRVGERLSSPDCPTELVVAQPLERGHWLVRPNPPISPLEWLAQVGQTPLPPYIHRGADGRGAPEPVDAERYQTVYADRPGAVAAPTAGLHFTSDLLERLVAGGMQRVHVTLHVGPGTFAPIQTEELADHRMHAEWYEITPGALATLRSTRAAGGRIIAVGTTSVRVLESLPDGALDADVEAGATPDGRRVNGDVLDIAGGLSGETDPLTAGTAVAHGHSGWTDIFIYPPYRFRHVDRLITNFHLPGSTLLALVMAFATPAQILLAYRTAIEQKYRFYSYGDAMLVL